MTIDLVVLEITLFDFRDKALFCAYRILEGVIICIISTNNVDPAKFNTF